MDNRVTTITADVPIAGGAVDIGTMFYIMPVTRQFYDSHGRLIPVEQQKGDDIPVQPGNGVILSARVDKMTRGWWKKAFFKNNILSDMTILGKNVNFKISARKLYITGCNSLFMIEEAGLMLLNKLEQAFRELTWMQLHPEATEQVINYLIRTIVDERGFIVMPPNLETPPELDVTITELLLDLANDYETWENYINIINMLLRAPPSIQYDADVTKLSVGPIMIKMVNRIFTLPKNIQLLNFALCVLHFDMAMNNCLAEILQTARPELAEHSKYLIRNYRTKEPHLAFLLDAHASDIEYLTLSPRVEAGLRNIKVDLATWQKNFILKYGYFPQIRLVIDFDNNLDKNNKIIAFHFSSDGQPMHHTFLAHLSGSTTQSSSSDACVGAIRNFFEEFINLYRPYIFVDAPPLFSIL